MKNQPNKAPVKDGLPIPKPTGDFIIGKADKVGIDGHYYHYQPVCRMLQEYSDQQNAGLRERVKELEATDPAQAVLAEGYHRLQSENERYREALEKIDGIASDRLSDFAKTIGGIAKEALKQQ